MQIHGSYGYSRDLPIERYLRDKLCEIGEGTSQVQRLVIARHVLKGQKAAQARAPRTPTEYLNQKDFILFRASTALNEVGGFLCKVGSVNPR